jgi:excisionase family DNA binding protein
MLEGVSMDFFMQEDAGMTKRLYSITETAETMSVSEDTVRRLINKKVLLAVRISRRILVPLAEIERACTQGIGGTK